MPIDHHHDHDHDHHHDHDSWWEQIASALHLPGYGHSHARPGRADALFNNELGIKTIKIALLALGITTLIQIVIYVASGSVALLADTVHNFGDALNSIPLWIAFVLARRAATRRYTYGFGRAEDVAGLLIVLSIAFSAGYILYESISKFINPDPITNLGAVAAAAVIGFVGNELVAILQIRVGKQIGSDAMVADGLHARTDGLTSLAVLFAVGGTWLGYPIVDPVVGLLIGVAIIFITWDAIKTMWFRLMDAIDPALSEKAEHSIHQHDAVEALTRLRMRWVGHSLNLEARITTAERLSLPQTAALADQISHALYHVLPNLDDVVIQIVPADYQSETHDHH